MKSSRDDYDEDILEPVSPKIFKALGKIVGGIGVGYLLVLGINAIAEEDPGNRTPQHYNWKGYDPSRPAWEMRRFNYSNYSVEYMERGPAINPPSVQQYRDIHSGIRVQINGTWVDLEGIDQQDILNELNIEYEDLYEYLMD